MAIDVRDGDIRIPNVIATFDNSKTRLKEHVEPLPFGDTPMFGPLVPVLVNVDVGGRRYECGINIVCLNDLFVFHFRANASDGFSYNNCLYLLHLTVSVKRVIRLFFSTRLKMDAIILRVPY